ncbi:MAG: polyribonucleotide nucleotidyltransferase [Bacteroidetes bacterium B1(2017)]|nr:MAG: polyribonucleotide nucleotidyltransferase [Bacteroidetes bacterium B1(2017)]
MSIATTKTFELDGKTISIETGRLARQADGAVVVRMGDTMIMATVVSAKEAKEDVDFMPLTVDYQEKFASVGRIPGSFHKREAKLSDYEVLVSRIVDRALRPLFPENYHADTQVALTLISSDANIMPDALVGLAASAALIVSDVPFNGPVSEVRVARIDGKFVINPYKDELERADIDLIVAGTEHDLNMVEGECAEVSEMDMLEAMKVAHNAIKVQIKAQWELVEMLGGKKPTREYNHERSNPELEAEILAYAYDKVYAVAKSKAGKGERSAAFKAIREEYKASLPEGTVVDKFLLNKYFHDVEYAAVRAMILADRTRLDGRNLDEVRPIWSEVGYLPGAHGSAIFTRGETQSLTTVTLGTKNDEQLLDSPMNAGYSKFMLHYNFPSFSTGEVKPNRGPGRREIGHGNLALRGIKRVLPGAPENPYTVRIVSDILESNGSSSMATVCAGSLALMDAGVKVRGAVSGIAMGLISDETTGKYAILSDILGDEDHLGDMDFKVVGTKNGIVACQMDIKINGLKWEMVEEALNQAKAGRLHIMNEMNKTISEPNSDYKPNAPRIVTLMIDKDFIGAIIGPGGKIIQGMQRDTGATISITEENNMGIVEVASNNKESLDKALGMIRAIVAVPEVGAEYTGKVKSIVDFGAFIEIMPGKDGLLHISEIGWNRLATMDGIFQVGEEVKVKLIEVDQKTGKLKLSRKVLLPKPEGYVEPAPRENRPPRDGNRSHSHDGRRDDRGPRPPREPRPE